MKRDRLSITAAEVLADLSYNPETGEFTRRRKINQVSAGSVAGARVASGARQIKLKGVDFMDYDLAWLLKTGSHPTGKVIPKDGDRSNCAADNLMEIHAGSELTQEIVRALLDYDESTGEFRWRFAVGQRASAGDSAGCVGTNGYVHMSVNGCVCYGHRLAWLYVYGEWPSEQIDHINGQRDDNRIANLRDVSHTENCHNKRAALPSNKSSGLLGVSWSQVMNKFVAQIVCNGVSHRLGYFDDKHEAHAEYVKAKRVMHSTCTI